MVALRLDSPAAHDKVLKSLPPKMGVGAPTSFLAPGAINTSYAPCVELRGEFVRGDFVEERLC